MKLKVLIGAAVIALGVVLGVVSFLESTIEYGDFATARKTQKKIQVKGEWIKEMDTSFDSEKMQFSFYMRDDRNEIVRVILSGPKPNNFEIANSIVAKGRYYDGYFHATEILTKCPSKYEGATLPTK